jgi:hypothetical protein
MLAGARRNLQRAALRREQLAHYVQDGLLVAVGGGAEVGRGLYHTPDPVIFGRTPLPKNKAPLARPMLARLSGLVNTLIHNLTHSRQGQVFFSFFRIAWAKQTRIYAWVLPLLR